MQGDIHNDQESVASGASLTIRPASGAGYAVHAYYLPAFSAEVYLNSAAGALQLNSFTGARLISDFVRHITNDVWLTIKNTHASAHRFGWSAAEVGSDSDNVGDVVAALATVFYPETLDIRPPSDHAWAITELFLGTNYTITLVKDGDGEIETISDDVSAPGTVTVLDGQGFELTHESFLRITNIDPTSEGSLFGYGGAVIQ